MDLRQQYKSTIVAKLKASGKYPNPMEIPRIKKVVVNMGIDAETDKDSFKAITDDLTRITGQKALVTKSRKSIANFKLREGMPVGAKVTLRGPRMYEFLDRMINHALPRIRDFRGIPKRGFDGHGCYTLGLKEQTIFPEIMPDQIKKVHGMDVTIVTTAKTNEETRELLKLMGMPFEGNG